MLKIDMKEIVEKAIKEYNMYRVPEAEATLLSIGDHEFKVMFRVFCLTCGLYDYFEDLKYVLEDLGVKARIRELEETSDGFIVTFEVEGEGRT